MQYLKLFTLAALLILVACTPTMDVKDEAKMSPMQYQMEQGMGAWDAKTSTFDVDKSKHGTWLNFGLRFHYAALKDLVTIENLEKAAGVKIFKSGPHGSDLNFKSAGNFGHYNDAFIKNIAKTFKRAATNQAFNKLGQATYNSQMKNLAQVYYKTYKHLKSGADYSPNYAHTKGKRVSLDEIKNMYLAKMKEGEEGRSGNYLQSAFHGLAEKIGGDSDNWYLSNVAAGFWVRRMIDGTDDEFISLLETIMNEYDKEGMNAK